MTDYTDAIERNLQGVEAFSTGVACGCSECGTESYDDPNDIPEELGEGSFSWSACESCDSTLGGDRYPAHGWVDGSLCHWSICVDCLFFHNYGTVPD